MFGIKLQIILLLTTWSAIATQGNPMVLLNFPWNEEAAKKWITEKIDAVVEDIETAIAELIMTLKNVITQKLQHNHTAVEIEEIINKLLHFIFNKDSYHPECYNNNLNRLKLLAFKQENIENNGNDLGLSLPGATCIFAAIEDVGTLVKRCAQFITHLKDIKRDWDATYGIRDTKCGTSGWFYILNCIYYYVQLAVKEISQGMNEGVGLIDSVKNLIYDIKFKMADCNNNQLLEIDQQNVNYFIDNAQTCNNLKNNFIY